MKDLSVGMSASHVLDVELRPQINRKLNVLVA